MAGAYGEAYDDAYDVLAGGGGAAGGWNGLLGILRTAQQERLDNDARPPVACPVHGEPLESARGLLHCRVGHLVSADSTLY